jgi:hypothetical protein
MVVLPQVNVSIVLWRYLPEAWIAKVKYPNKKMKETIDLKEIPRCPKCDGLVKPNIVFFGEALPASFWTSRHDMHRAGTASFPVNLC